MVMPMIHSGLTIDEIEVFTQAARLHSLREVCRQLSMQPARATKAIQNLERKVGHKLLLRSVQGVSLTPEGHELLGTCEKIMELVPHLELGRKKNIKKREIREVCSIGSLSFISSRLVAPCLGVLGAKRPETRFRLVEFTDNELVAHGLKGAFDIAIHIEPLSWTRAWTTQSLGHLRWALFGRTGHPLGPQTTEERALNFPFVVPTGWTDAGYMMGIDHCPVQAQFRLKGNEATTAETAIEMIQVTDHLTYIPEIMARGATLKSQVQEIRVHDWPKTSHEMLISVHSSRVSKPLFNAIRDELRRAIRN